VRALYVSQNGMLENLGQSQVLPYLVGLARRGVELDLLSFELANADEGAIETLRSSLGRSGVRWTPLRRQRDPRLRVKFAESARGVVKALTMALARRPDIVHGRSYLPTAICDVVATLVPRARMLFDCRGMLGDEYVDAGYWTKDRVEYKLVKRYEARAFGRAEGVVVLTEALKQWVLERGWLGRGTHIEAVPCCVDLERFRFDEPARERLKRELGLEDAFVLVYAGSLGTWYCEEEVARFAGRLKRESGRRVAFLLLTPSPPEVLTGYLRREGFGDADIVTRKVAPRDMAAHLSVGDAAVSFITSCFSKKGSSPTKVAEYLACGLPVVLNGDIGDQNDLATEADACVVIGTFSDDEMARAVPRLLELGNREKAERVRSGRRVAEERFGVDHVGVARYERLYRAMVSGQAAR
jgi:glycosyltransferase involved in cell wall biosynthesis